MNLSEKILKAKLTKSERKVADYYIKNPLENCLKTAATVAGEVGVSDASVIRFTRVLGYKSFSEFRYDMEKSVIEHINNVDNMLSPSIKYKKVIEEFKEKNLVSLMLEHTMENIHTSFTHIDEKLIRDAAKIIIESNKKLIVAFRSSSTLASFLAIRLKYIMPGVINCIHADGELVENIMEIEKGDCLILYTFSSYTYKDACLMAIEIAKKKGISVIVVTDKLTSPVANKADILFTMSVNSLGFWVNHIAPMCFNELLLTQIMSMMPEAEKRVTEMSELLGTNIHKIIKSRKV